MPVLVIDVELVTFILVGLLGGAHCLGMCGPLVTTYTQAVDSPPGQVTLLDVRQQTLFSLGRITAYAVMGALFGTVGSLLVAGSRLFAVVDLVRGTLGIVAGLLILAVGMGYLRGQPVDTGGVFVPKPGGLSAQLANAVSDRANIWADGNRVVLLGTVHALLPCPLLYPAYLYAFARASPVAGAAALAALGLGTVPPLVGYTTVIEAVPLRLRASLHRALGAAFLLLGVIPLMHGLRVLGAPIPPIHMPQYAGVPNL